MLFKSREVCCTLEVLKILNKGKSKYSIMFKKTKVSHTTLQRVLNELVEKKFVLKNNKGHMDVDYEICERGRRLLGVLLALERVLK